MQHIDLEKDKIPVMQGKDFDLSVTPFEAHRPVVDLTVFRISASTLSLCGMTTIAAYPMNGGRAKNGIA